MVTATICLLLSLCALALASSQASEAPLPSSSCLVPDVNYSFPVSLPFPPDYFQWLRELSDARTHQYFSGASEHLMSTFMEARVQHIYDHIHGKTGPHTVCMPQHFNQTFDEQQAAHWLIDYAYLHRLVRLLPRVHIKPSTLEKDFADGLGYPIS